MMFLDGKNIMEKRRKMKIICRIFTEINEELLDRPKPSQ